MAEKSNRFISKEVKRFTVIAIISIAITLFLSYHVANLLFGVNSFEVYKSLKNKRSYLISEINRLQESNARLQKEYFELKNLEPEE
ncbi:septum formation initiator [Arcobacter sp. F2176]|mgnify:CR=1 FL=1|jgi:cell division protein FtsB|uniref:septum formation initiator n=1 Tax=Arcobacter TaxID=28196 RepID=UPI00100C1665|nr:septum formation initiator [Arcobacter sp. F2176]RXJ81094.1 septum formation initiator [Arcobacter sp. F2176]|tara:strand:- start:1015 stop:1272 length:258 start_codon:yes stop_codon:yes gene_type:complete